MKESSASASNAYGLPSDPVAQKFYDWERRGRGWLIAEYPIRPEPPFEPFAAWNEWQSAVMDDGRKPTTIRKAIESVANLLRAQGTTAPEKHRTESPERFIREAMVEIKLLPTADFEAQEGFLEQFLQSSCLGSEPIAFELVGSASRVAAQFALHASDVHRFCEQLQAFFPDLGFSSTEATLPNLWGCPESCPSLIFEFGLRREFMRPLVDSGIDVFVPLVGVLSDLREREVGVFQVLFEPVRNAWAESILLAVTNHKGESLFRDAPELVSQARQKVAHPLYGVVIRLAAKSPNPARLRAISHSLAGALAVLSNPSGNDFVPLPNDRYPAQDHELDLMRRQSRRFGMILNATELVGLVHVPSRDVRSSAFQRQRFKTHPAPRLATTGSGLVLGKNTHASKSVWVAIPTEHRARHVHILGASGSGKTTLLLNLIYQDIKSGQGLAVFDPHGDLVETIVGHVPEERFRDVVFVDPSDADFPIGFNILGPSSALEKTLIASDLVSIFRRLSTSWGDQMNAVLANSILAFLESERSGTLLDLRRFLLEPEFRKEFLATVRDPEIVYYWQRQYPLLKGNSHASILTRLDELLRHKSLRAMVGQRVNRLDLARIMDEGKILLVKLAHGAIGQSNAYLLGSLIVAKLHQVVLGRQQPAEGSRRYFWTPENIG